MRPRLLVILSILVVFPVALLAGLAIWLDLTQDWFEGDSPSAAWESLA